MRRPLAALTVVVVAAAGVVVQAATPQTGSVVTAPAVAGSAGAAGGPGAASSSTTRPSPTGAPAAGASTTAPTPHTPLQRALDAVLVNTDSCLLVTDAATGAVVYSHQADVPFTPASSQKLLVALAALDRFGPDHRFATTVVARRTPAGGVVDDLWLVGGGDPLLATPEYAAALQTSPATLGYPTTPVGSLADQLAARGVRVVRNGVHGDGSFYTTPPYLPTWAPSINRGEFDVGPLSALEVDQGLDSWHPAVPAPDPAGHGADVLARLLGQRGVTAPAGPDATAPAGATVLAVVESAPLSQIIGAMLRASDNQIAELLVLALDRQAGGAGSTAGGVRQVAAAAARLGLPVAGLSLVDGSGLSATDHVTCSTLLGALDLGYQPRFSAIGNGLPVAGVSGTLTHLFSGTPLAGRLAAKGGYLSGVTALVGQVSGPHPTRFAFVANGRLPFADGLALSERVAESV